MDSGQVKTFCDAAAQLLPQIGAYAAAPNAEHSADDDGLVRQLRVAASAINNALMEVSRMTPPPMPPMPVPQQAPPAASA